MYSLRSYYSNNVAIGDTITFNSHLSTLNFTLFYKYYIIKLKK